VTREWLGWFVAGIGVLLTCTLWVMVQQWGIGRYQLIEGRFIAVRGEGLDIRKEEVVSVFRIDTVTGKVGRFQAIFGPGVTAVGWERVDDLGEK
jgi:hypothetical protein